ncbi:hypothetical protein [Geodermatophilus sp. SYSU D00766]
MKRQVNDAAAGGAGRRQKRWYALVAAVVVVVVVGIAVFVWLSEDDEERSDAGPTGPTATAFPTPSPDVATVEPVAPFTQADADRITSALNSGDDATVAGVLVPELREAFASAEGAVLPAGATAAVRTEEFVAVEPALGGVPLIVSGEGAGNFLLIVSYVEGQWLVVSTEEVQ